MTSIHYFYKITNTINGNYYYGVHNTNNINDGYMGSGKYLKSAYEKYGIENFKKEIIKFFSSSDEAFEYEKSVVTIDLVNDPNCYNIKNGGDGWQNQYIKKDKVVVTDGQHIFQIDKNDERYISGELKSINFGKIPTKDSNGKLHMVTKNDERYISGELLPLSKNRKLSDEHKLKLSKIAKEKNFGKKKDTYCWIYKIDENNNYINKSIQKNELDNYINNGWIIGRKTGTLCLAKEYKNNTGSVCPICSNRFPKATGKKYCSKECRDVAEGRNKYPTKDDILNRYVELKSWQKVADSFGLTRRIIQRIRNIK